MRSTHTYVELPVSSAAHAEIRAKLEAAGYHHALHGEAIDMHGIALIPDRSEAIEVARQNSPQSIVSPAIHVQAFA